MNALVLLWLALATAGDGSNVVVCPPFDGDGPSVDIPEFPDFGQHPGGQG